MVGSINLKCTVSEKHSEDLCPEECGVPEEDQILGPSARGDGGIVETIRFCFYECQPLGGKKAPVASECIAFDGAEARLLTDNEGNPKDPAVVEAEAGRVSKMAKANRSSALLASKAKIDPAAAGVLARTMQRQAAFEGMAAGNEATATRDMEVAHAESLNGRLKAAIEARKSGGAMDPFQAMADIAKAKVGAEDNAKVAGEALQEAIASLQEGRKVAWNSAVATGQAAMAAVKAEQVAADAKKAAKKAAKVNQVEERMKAAAKKAAAPYHLSMLRSEEQVAIYTEKAEKYAADAENMKNQANALAAEANAAKAKGDMGLANTKIEEAKEMMARAKEGAKTAKQFFATADQINMDLPKFSAAATAAAIQAAYNEQPAWHGTRPGTDMR